MRILVAEDDLPVAAVMRLALIRQGWEVDLAADGLEATEKGLAGSYDLILMDYRMPGCSGGEAARRILAARPGQRLAIVTGSPAGHGPGQVEDVEGTYRLNKPFTPGELVTTVRGWLGEAGGRISRDKT